MTRRAIKVIGSVRLQAWEWINSLNNFRLFEPEQLNISLFEMNILVIFPVIMTFAEGFIVLTVSCKHKINSFTGGTLQLQFGLIGNRVKLAINNLGILCILILSRMFMKTIFLLPLGLYSVNIF